MFTPQ